MNAEPPVDVDDQELQRVSDAWVIATEAGRGPAYEAHWWAVERVIDWTLERQADLLWRFVLTTSSRELSPKAIAVLAAGPLEELLVLAGADYIARVEERARRDPRFNHLLGGVWKNSMTEEVWSRVRAARLRTW